MKSIEIALCFFWKFPLQSIMTLGQKTAWVSFKFLIFQALRFFFKEIDKKNNYLQHFLVPFSYYFLFFSVCPCWWRDDDDKKKKKKWQIKIKKHKKKICICMKECVCIDISISIDIHKVRYQHRCAFCSFLAPGTTSIISVLKCKKDKKR